LLTALTRPADHQPKRPAHDFAGQRHATRVEIAGVFQRDGQAGLGGQQGQKGKANHGHMRCHRALHGRFSSSCRGGRIRPAALTEAEPRARNACASKKGGTLAPPPHALAS